MIKQYKNTNPNVDARIQSLLFRSKRAKHTAFSVAVMLAAFIYSTFTFAGISLPNGTVSEYVEDMRVETLAGPVVIDRQYMEGRWEVNARWKPAVYSGVPQTTGSCVAYPTIKVREREYSGDGVAWSLENRYTIRAKDYFAGADCEANRIQTLRWQDRNTGQWMEFQRADETQLQYQLVRYGDRNDNTITLDYDTAVQPDLANLTAGKVKYVRDTNNNILYTYTYTGNQLTEIQDNPSIVSANTVAPRSVKYAYTSTTYKGQSYQTINQVTDVKGNVTKYGITNGELTSIEDAESTVAKPRIQRYNYSAGRVVKYTDAIGSETTYKYDYDKNKQEFYVRVDAPPATPSATEHLITENWYSKEGDLIRRDLNGKTSYAKTEEDTATRSYVITDGSGNRTKLTEDEYGNVIKAEYADSSVVSATFSSIHGGILTFTDELGVKVQYDYDAKGNLIKVTEAVGLPEERITEYVVNPLGLVTELISRGRTETNGAVTPDATWLFTYNTLGEIETLTDPENHVWTYTYDYRGNLLSEADPKSGLTQFEVDANDQLVTEIDALNKTVRYTYDKVGNQTALFDERNKQYKFDYDVKNRLVKRISPTGDTFQTNYNAYNQVASVLDGAGKGMEMQYDALARLVKSVDSKQQAYELSYTDPVEGVDNGRRRPNQVKYPTFSRLLRYDSRNRLVLQNDTDGSETRVMSYSYDKTGRRKTYTDPNGKTLTNIYNAHGELVQVQDPLGNTMQLVLDARGNIIELTDPNSKSYTLQYDKRDLMTSSIDPLGKTTRYTYDERGWLSRIEQANGQVVDYLFDAVGRITEQKETNALGSVYKTTAFTYDDAGNLTSWDDGTYSANRTYDDADRMLDETISYSGSSTFNLNYSYTYYGNNQIKTYTGPDGQTISYEYDGASQLQQVSIPGEGNITISDWQWFQPKKVLLPGGSQQVKEYDAYQNMTRFKLISPLQAVLFDMQNQYGKLDEVTQSDIDGNSNTYNYDAIARLQSVEGNAPESFTLDANNNRLTHSRTGTFEWQYDDANQLKQRPNAGGNGTISYAYDDSGNLISKTDSTLAGLAGVTQYRYDAFNRLTQITDGNGQTIASYSYDPFDRRLSKAVVEGGNTNTTYFLPSPWGLLAEANSSGQLQTLYGWSPQRDNGDNPLFARVTDPANAANATPSNAALRYVYYHNDQLGKPLRLTDNAGNLVWSANYDAFGKANVQLPSDAQLAVNNNLRFPGQYFDAESGLHYNDRRYYDPESGRYISRDPIGFEGGLNLYTYVGGSPTRLTDPTGEILPWVGCLAWNYARCMLGCTAIDTATQYAFNCGNVDIAGTLKSCAVDCVIGMLPIPNPCGRVGKLLSVGAGAVAGMYEAFNSFPAQTLVHVREQTDQGTIATTKPISEIQVGDEVLAWDEQATFDATAKAKASDVQATAVPSIQRYEKVTDIISSHKKQTLVHITLDSGEKLTATDGHPFKTSEGWRNAVLLKKGGKLLLKDSGDEADTTKQYATITDINTEVKTVPVFNLEVANLHTYYVGEDGVVVHNGNGAYVITYPDGTRYVGKGDGARAKVSERQHRKGRGGKGKCKLYRARNKDESFIKEDRLIEKYGDIGDKNLLNKINSPGKKLRGR